MKRKHKYEITNLNNKKNKVNIPRVKRPYQICNWTFQRNVVGFPAYFLKTKGFIKLTNVLKGLKFFKQRNDQMETKINLNEFIKRDSNLGKELKKPIIKIILSNCTDRSILIKIIGVKNKNKVKFGFKIVQEKLGNIYDPVLKTKLKHILKFGKITTTNIVVTWSIPKSILINFELIKIKFGNMCSYQPSKIPLMRLRFETPKLNPSKWVVIISRNGKCMIPGLKTLNDIFIRQTKIENLFLKLWDKKTINDYLNNKFNNIELEIEIDSKEKEEAGSDRLHFIKSENYFWFINENGNKTKPTKYFNKADYKKPKKGFEQRINSLQFIHKYDLPNQGVEFYLKHNRILRNQCKSIVFQ